MGGGNGIFKLLWGGATVRFSLVCCCGCRVECTPKWVGTSGLHGTGWKTLGVTELERVCNDNEAVPSRGRGRPGIHTLRLFFFNPVEFFQNFLNMFAFFLSKIRGKEVGPHPPTL